MPRCQYIYQPLDWDWAAAEAELQRALPLILTDPLALQAPGYSLLLSAVGTRRSGNFGRHLSVIR